MATRKPPRRSAVAPALPGDVRAMNALAALLFVGALVAFAVQAAKWATRSPVFTLRAIALETTPQRSNLAAVRAHALPRLAGNFFSIDLDAARAAFEAVPWVRRATVRRVWPNRIAVALEEHQAAALWQGDSRRADRLVNRQGEVFEANLGDVDDEALPTLAGDDAQSARLLAMLQRLAPLFEPWDERVAVLRLTPRGSWRAELGGRARLELGRGSDDEVVARVERFARTLADVSARLNAGSPPSALRHADLRHPEGYALRLAGIATTPTAATNK
jgi:cell division protein FtsQ